MQNTHEKAELEGVKTLSSFKSEMQAFHRIRV